MRYVGDEAWKDVIGYEGLYQISDLGRVKSLARRVRRGDGTRLVRERILKPALESHGYLNVSLSRAGFTKKHKIATLVLEAFRGPRPEGYVTRHFPDRNPKNNRLTNLQWGTKQVNNGPDKVFQGTTNRGERCGTSKLTEQEVREIRMSIEKYNHLRKRYGVSWTTIHDIKKGKTWGHLT